MNGEVLSSPRLPVTVQGGKYTYKASSTQRTYDTLLEFKQAADATFFTENDLQSGTGLLEWRSSYQVFYIQRSYDMQAIP